MPQVWRDMDTTLAAAPLGDHRTAVVLGAPGGPAFRPSEVARLGYLGRDRRDDPALSPSATPPAGTG